MRLLSIKVYQLRSLFSHLTNLLKNILSQIYRILPLKGNRILNTRKRVLLLYTQLTFLVYNNSNNLKY